MKNSVVFFLLVVVSTLCANDSFSALDFEVRNLEAQLLQESNEPKTKPRGAFVKEIREADREVVLEDGSIWKINWWYRAELSRWKRGDPLKIALESDLNNVKFENPAVSSIAYGVLSKAPDLSKSDSIAYITHDTLEFSGGMRFILASGDIYKGPTVNWRVKDHLFVFRNEKNLALWNLDRREMIAGFTYLGAEEGAISENSVTIEGRVNRRVLGQSEAVAVVSTAVMNYWAGLNDPATPIGVFLFLGPTGVGKTELAKTLTDELFIDRSYLIRFDMSHFVEPHTVSRLIGSPPGYVNHDEGGQLTEALKARPSSIVLLDEIEKANPAVRKLFLPVFDDGYITDASNCTVRCNHTLFIMTSNICALEIAKLFREGMSSEKVLETIEPELIERLSPELFNRVIPIVFHPLGEEVMGDLVDLMLHEMILRLKEVKGMELIVDKTAKAYLIEKGFHPLLGARPLKRLIQKKVVATLSYAIVNENIPKGARLVLSFDKSRDAWHVNWH